ncbi:MAG: LytTR family DNA-binding domain-containing protein [Bryobacteraceae bacterium]
MKTLIVDDEPIAREVLREHIESSAGLEIVGEAVNGPEAAEKILSLRPDLVFMDLEMPGQNGLSVARSLRGGAPVIVFVTAYEQHALAAFEVGAVDYLLKPIRRERFLRAVDKARQQLAGLSTPQKPEPAAVHPASRKIPGKRGSDIYLLDPAEIVAFEADGELVHIITPTQRYLSENTLKALEEKLDPLRFRRIHRKTIINTDQIRKISPLSSKRWLLRMANGYEATVSKRMAGAIREQSRS